MTGRPGPRTYRCQVSVEKVTEHLYVVRSVPYPLHAAQVKAYLHREHVSSWSVTMLTTDLHRRMPGLPLMEGLALAADWVGGLAGQMMKERFHGVQRTAMGQGKCPYLGRVLCLGVPTPGSVWCVYHPNGKKAIDDAPV